MKISEIAEKCGYQYCGNDYDVNLVREWNCADKNDIAIIKSDEYISETNANCILTEPTIIMTDKTIIYAADPIEYAAIRIALLLQSEKIQSDCQSQYVVKDNYYIGNNVVIGKNTYIGPNTCIDNDVIIGDNCNISSNVHIGKGTIINNGVKIGNGSFVGSESFYHYYDDDGLKEFEGLGIVIIEDEVYIGNNTTIQRGTFSDTIIGSRSKIGNLIDIGHDVCIGTDCKVVSQTGIASKVRIGNYVTIYGQTGISNNVVIGDRAIVYAKSLVTKSVKENQHVSGMYARNHTDELRIQAKIRRL